MGLLDFSKERQSKKQPNLTKLLMILINKNQQMKKGLPIFTQLRKLHIKTKWTP